jgi:DNA-binding transcriptional LysR family regulator
MLYRWDIWLASNKIDVLDLNYPFRFDRSSMSIELAKQGGGLVLESISLCLPELENGQLVPFSTEFDVVDFPAYWFVCPPRHLNRRIVSRFAEWLGAACKEHELRARAALGGLGCTFRPEMGPQLLDVKPREPQ